MAIIQFDEEKIQRIITGFKKVLSFCGKHWLKIAAAVTIIWAIFDIYLRLLGRK